MVEPLPRDDAFALLVSVLEAVHAQTTFDGALYATMRALLVETGWTLGEAWIPDRDGNVLTLARSRAARADDPRVAGFMKASEEVTMARGVGLPGRVLASGRHEWITDVTALDERTYRRISLAHAAGIHAALAVPVLAAGNVVAVLVFYMDAPQPEDSARVELVAAAARELGIALQRVKEKELRTQLQEQIEALAIPIMELADRVALAPVVGDLDRSLAGMLTERVLAYVEKKRARVVIVDLTGVRSLDSDNARALIDLGRACRMLGAQTVLTGVRASFARTLVLLGVSFADLRTEVSLAAGLERALEIAEAPLWSRARATL